MDVLGECFPMQLRVQSPSYVLLVLSGETVL